MSAASLVELALLALAWTAALLVRPWRLLRPHQGRVRLASPLLACLAVLPWLWSVPGPVALPVPCHWSGAPLAVLLLGWPLAVPVLTLAGLGTLLTADATPAAALSQTVWSGLAPATLVLLLGHAVRTAFGSLPLPYMIGRAFLVPLLALAGCGFAAAWLGGAFSAPAGELQRIAVALMAIGEAALTCAAASLLVAFRPHWLATWTPPSTAQRAARITRAVPPHR